ncbi:MAG: glycosyltransferase [Deltaproteobacteria bacterium]|nr:glycosyltransferase [Deltaproteobacteria bacterium]
MKSPFCSVIIPTFNRKTQLIKAVESVLKQNYQHFELIVVDDGSTDESCQSLKEVEDSRLKIFHQLNKGVSAARNLGFQKSEGKWIAFLDSDDLWLECKLSRQMEFHFNHPTIRISQTDDIWIRNGKRVNPGLRHQKPKGDFFSQSLALCCVSPSSVIMHRSLFDELDGFDEKMPACEDYDLWLRISAKYPIGLIKDRLVVKYGGHDDQLSRAFDAMDRFRIFSILKVLVSGILSETQSSSALSVCIEKLQILIKGARKRSPPPPLELLKLYEHLQAGETPKLSGLLKELTPYFLEGRARSK